MAQQSAWGVPSDLLRKRTSELKPRISPWPKGQAPVASATLWDTAVQWCTWRWTPAGGGWPRPSEGGGASSGAGRGGAFPTGTASASFFFLRSDDAIKSNHFSVRFLLIKMLFICSFFAGAFLGVSE